MHKKKKTGAIFVRFQCILIGRWIFNAVLNMRQKCSMRYLKKKKKTTTDPQMTGVNCSKL